jgi:hypothetical protein
MEKKVSLTIMLLSFVSMVLLSSCAVFTRATEGTTETLENTSEASTDFTSSTSPRDDDSSQAEKTRAFAAANLDRLREDMARGGGEHLASLAHLLGVSPNHREDFFVLTREKYPVLFSSEPTVPEDLLARLDTELNAHPRWRQ